jgi:hypothetical protein
VSSVRGRVVKAILALILEWLKYLLARGKFKCTKCGERFPVTPDKPIRGMCCICAQGSITTPVQGARTMGQARKGTNPPGHPISPYSYSAMDVNGATISINVPFNETTLALQDGVVTRDSACLYRRILIGVGPDGSPETSSHIYTIPAGTSALRATTLAANGLASYTDLLDLQITAAP